MILYHDNFLTIVASTTYIYKLALRIWIDGSCYKYIVNKELLDDS